MFCPKAFHSPFIAYRLLLYQIERYRFLSAVLILSILTALFDDPVNQSFCLFSFIIPAPGDSVPLWGGV